MKSFKEIKKDITAIINQIDPMQLISEGAPHDEYDTEIDQLISLYFRNQLNEENLKKTWGLLGENSTNFILQIKSEVEIYFKNNPVNITNFKDT